MTDQDSPSFKQYKLAIRVAQWAMSDAAQVVSGDIRDAIMEVADIPILAHLQTAKGSARDRRHVFAFIAARAREHGDRPEIDEASLTELRHHGLIRVEDGILALTPLGVRVAIDLQIAPYDR